MLNREDWLVEQLNKDELNEAVKLAYEAELDAIAERQTKAKARQALEEQREKARKAEIRAKLLKNDQDLISALGQEEFGHDYELVTEGSDFVVYSKVARDDQEHRRAHSTLEAAQADLRYLLYNRLYDRYVREGEVNFLGELA